jgi:5-formyltetrahydrofolate cyclo-ligase
MTDAVDWKSFRRAERDRLLEARRAIGAAERERLTAALADQLDAAVPPQPGGALGLYWPIKGEIDIRAWAEAFAARHAMTLALPVVVEKAAPLEFRAWAPGDAMERGFWNILVPAVRTVVVPAVVIAPLVGFQAAGTWRLGYGGGYFDRTLASLAPRPFAVGLGLDGAELATIHPQPHDVPMDVLVTETRILPAAQSFSR